MKRIYKNDSENELGTWRSKREHELVKTRERLVWQCTPFNIPEAGAGWISVEFETSLTSTVSPRTIKKVVVSSQWCSLSAPHMTGHTARLALSDNHFHLMPLLRALPTLKEAITETIMPAAALTSLHRRKCCDGK